MIFTADTQKGEPMSDFVKDTNVPTNGYISRQAAIDIMAELQGRATTKAELKAISKAWKKIKKLPSAQPELRRGEGS